MAEANGFSAVTDPPPLSIAEDNVAPFSLPQEALNFQPGELELISKFAGGDQERKIHCNIELRPDEMERLKVLQEEAKKAGRSYYASITVMATRYMSYARGDPKKAIAMMDETQQWRTEYFGNGPLSDESLKEDLSSGVLYFTGRDYALRPILVIRADRVPDAWHKDGSGITRLIRMLVFCMEYLRRYMFVPGKIENIVVLIDLKNLGIRDVPIKALKSIYSVLSHHYIVRVFRFYIMNMSYMLSTLVSVVTPILTDRQRQKLNFLKDNTGCKEWVALHHLEEDLGGTRPRIEKFFPFPLLPGPFNGGCTDGPRKDAVPNCHRAMTMEGFRGRLWDPSQSAEENSSYEYTEFAEDIFNSCGLPIPANCPRKKVEEAEAKPAEPEGLEEKKQVVSLDNEPVEPASQPKEKEEAANEASADAKEEGFEGKSSMQTQSGGASATGSMEVNAPEESRDTQQKEKKKQKSPQCCTVM